MRISYTHLFARPYPSTWAWLIAIYLSSFRIYRLNLTFSHCFTFTLVTTCSRYLYWFFSVSCHSQLIPFEQEEVSMTPSRTLVDWHYLHRIYGQWRLRITLHTRTRYTSACTWIFTFGSFVRISPAIRSRFRASPFEGRMRILQTFMTT